MHKKNFWLAKVFGNLMGIQQKKNRKKKKKKKRRKKKKEKKKKKKKRRRKIKIAQGKGCRGVGYCRLVYNCKGWESEAVPRNLCGTLLCTLVEHLE